ncbi:MAG: DUF1858 domain-containing protein [Ruminococcus sp.]|nr:DUF1858 domain-containing protein [Ruminococcus sp.]HRR76807.1 DUF1858 domain-containing protein [Ruminococcus sp.]
MDVTMEAIIGFIPDADWTLQRFSRKYGMHCLGCPASCGESVKKACDICGTDPDMLVEKA